MGLPFSIIKRQEWGAVEPKARTPLAQPAEGVVFHRTGGKRCTSKASCLERIKKMQEEHMNERNLDDIRYNFLIGGDAKVYEGRGWTVQGEHTDGQVDHQAIAVAFIGNYDESEPEFEVLDAARGLMYYGVRYGYLKDTFEAVPHAEVNDATLCPGITILEECVHDTLDPGMYWRKTTFFGRLWDKCTGVSV